MIDFGGVLAIILSIAVTSFFGLIICVCYSWHRDEQEITRLKLDALRSAPSRRQYADSSHQEVHHFADRSAAAAPVGSRAPQATAPAPTLQSPSRTPRTANDALDRAAQRSVGAQLAVDMEVARFVRPENSQ